MSNVPPAPYGDEGDARPVSLIGADISASGPASGRPGDQRHEDDEDLRTPAGKRRHRRRQDDAPMPAAAAGDSAFHLGDGLPVDDPRQEDDERPTVPLPPTRAQIAARRARRPRPRPVPPSPGMPRTQPPARTSPPPAPTGWVPDVTAVDEPAASTPTAAAPPILTPPPVPAAATPGPGAPTGDEPGSITVESAHRQDDPAEHRTQPTLTPQAPPPPADWLAARPATANGTGPSRATGPSLTGPIPAPSRPAPLAGPDPATGPTPTTAPSDSHVAEPTPMPLRHSPTAPPPPQPAQAPPAAPRPTRPAVAPTPVPHPAAAPPTPAPAAPPPAPPGTAAPVPPPARQPAARTRPPRPVAPARHPEPAPAEPAPVSAPAAAAPSTPTPATPPGTAVARRSAPTAAPVPAAPGPHPWHDWDDIDNDDLWDEIPLRESLNDRAAAVLPGTWRIGVTSAFPYSGTTTLVGILGLVLAAARDESVLAVDLRPGEWPDEDPDEPRGDPLCPRVGLPGDVTVADIARLRGGAPAALREMIGASPDTRNTPELDVVPLSHVTAPASRRSSTEVVPTDDLVTPGMLRTALGQLTRAYPLVLVDAPVDAPLSPAALRACDLVIVVSLAAPADLDRTAAALRDPAAPLLPVDREGRRPPVIVAVISPRRGRWSPRTRAAAGRLAKQANAVVRIPYESRLDPSKRDAVRIPALRGGTRRAYLRLGVAVVEALLRLAAEEAARARIKSSTTRDDTTRGSTPETR